MACEILRNDGLVAYPSDVNWAFACDGTSARALNRAHALKPHHPKEQPFSLLCANISMASTVANVDNFAFAIMQKHCPGPYTFLLDRSRNLPRLMKDKRRTVGIRIPKCPLAQALVQRYGVPLATTSVPDCVPTGGAKLPPRFGYQVQEVFGHALDLVLDLGEESLAAESTVVSLVDGEVVLVRRGLGDPSHFE